MSYDIELRDPKTGRVIELDDRHQLRGGNYVIGGTHCAELNVTYNYGGHFRRVLGDKGIRTIYGMTGEESIPVLSSAIAQLAEDRDPDYWKATEGNARAALCDLRTLAAMCPYGVWGGD